MQTNFNRNTRNDKSVYANGIWIGRVTGDVFLKVIKKKYLLPKPVLSIGTSISALDDAEALGAKYCDVFVSDMDNGKRYRKSIKEIREKGTLINNRGDMQLRLALSEWSLV
jgi:hypothetical protein